MFDSKEITSGAQGVFRSEKERARDNARVETLRMVCLGTQISITGIVDSLTSDIVGSRYGIQNKLLFLQVLFHYDTENADLAAAIQSLLFQQKLTGEVRIPTSAQKTQAILKMQESYGEKIRELFDIVSAKKAALSEMFCLTVHEKPDIAYAVCEELVHISPEEKWTQELSNLKSRLQWEKIGSF